MILMAVPASLLNPEGASKPVKLPSRQNLQALKSGTEPSVRLLLGALKECSASRDLDSGGEIHALAVDTGAASNVFVANSLLDMYAKCGNMVQAHQLFEELPEKDVVSWSSLILGYAEKGEGQVALQLYVGMQREGCLPNRITHLAVLKALSRLAEKGNADDRCWCLSRGKSIHRLAAAQQQEVDTVVANSLIDMYGKCGSMVEAYQVFVTMTVRSMVSWTVIILGYAQNGQGTLALQLFSCMCNEGFIPNGITFVAALKACASLAEGEKRTAEGLEQGKAVHALSASEDGSNIYLGSSLLDMYAKCSSLHDAGRVFTRMPRRDVVCWSAFIMGCAQNGLSEKALELYAAMQDEGSPENCVTYVAVFKACGNLAELQGDQKAAWLDKGREIHRQARKGGHDRDFFVASSLIDMYSKCGSLADACQVFESMLQKNVVLWNCIILGCARNGEGDAALRLFTRMLAEGFEPDQGTVVAALKACSTLADMEVGKQVEGRLVKTASLEKCRMVHSEARRRGQDSDVFVASSLVDMYARCGSLHEARWVFESMPARDAVAWTSLIMGYADNGESEEALELYFRMEDGKCNRDPITYAAALRACANLAALETGRQIHSDICAAGVEADVVVSTSLVDFYGKCGSLDEAELVFGSVPVAKRDSASWGALISGYSRQGDVAGVFNVVDRMESSSAKVTDVVILAVLSVCSHTGLVDKGMKWFENMLVKFGVAPKMEHYNCMVDMLGRAGRVEDAVGLVENMPLNPSPVVWVTLLGAARKWKMVEVGNHAFESLLRLSGSPPASAYVLMASLYEAAGMLDEAAKVRALRLDSRAWKQPGRSWWTDTNTGKVHAFLACSRIICPTASN